MCCGGCTKDSAFNFSSSRVSKSRHAYLLWTKLFGLLLALRSLEQEG